MTNPQRCAMPMVVVLAGVTSPQTSMAVLAALQSPQMPMVVLAAVEQLPMVVLRASELDRSGSVGQDRPV